MKNPQLFPYNEVDANIAQMFRLAIKHETTGSSFEKQVVKMKAGKVKKFLREANAAAKQDRVGVKIDN